jgi:hypothetical protein
MRPESHLRDTASGSQRETVKSAWYALSIMLHLAVRPRSLALTPFIKSLHYHEGTLPAGVERIIPNAQAHLMVNLQEDEFRTYDGSDGRTVRA